MATKTYGYARVSTIDQHLDRQIIALKKAGVPEKHIFLDKQSGKDFQRPVYLKLISRLRKNDLLLIKNIDRLGRNYRDIQEQWKIITKEIGADIKVLDMPILDTRKGKDLIGTFLSDIVLQLLSFVAENERINIITRQKEGIAAAKARGVKFGRPQKPLPINFQENLSKWQAGKLSLRAASKLSKIPKSTFYYHAKKREKIATQSQKLPSNKA